MSAQPQTDSRKRLIRLIHVAKRDTGLDDASYRDLLERETGKRSAKDMSVSQLDQVLKAMKANGFKVRKPVSASTNAKVREFPRKPKSEARDGQKALITALWIDLWQLGAVRDRTDKALDAFIKRQTSIEHLQWLGPHQAHAVIEALKDWCAREGFEVPQNQQRTGVETGLVPAQELALAIYRKLEQRGVDVDAYTDQIFRRRELSKGEVEDLVSDLGSRLRADMR